MTLDWRAKVGMLAAPAAWAGSTQISQTLPYADCEKGTSWSLVFVLAGIAVALSGIIASYPGRGGDSRISSFLGHLRMGVALAIAFALLLQAIAAALLSPCQR